MKQILATSENIKVYDLPAPLLQTGTVLVEVNYSFISSGTELTTLNAIQSKTDITDSNFKKNYTGGDPKHNYPMYSYGQR